MMKMKMIKRPTKTLRLQPQPEKVTLRLSPTAWAKLLYLRDAGDTEVGGFGITTADDLLYVQDIELVRQVCTGASVVFDDEAVADYFDRQMDAGRRPEEFGRIWMHTHPGSCPQPSSTDRETFARVFGRTEWAIMFILAQGGETYARMEFHVGPGGSLLLPVEVDFRRSFPASDHAAWQAEYDANVQAEKVFLGIQDDFGLEPLGHELGFGPHRGLWDDSLDGILDGMHLIDHEGSASDDHR
jgi:hypothetical protein